MTKRQQMRRQPRRVASKSKSATSRKRKRSTASPSSSSRSSEVYSSVLYDDATRWFDTLHLSPNEAQKSLSEVYEWIGDAVIGEIVGRILLSQFEETPLSARVFRNLRLSVVTNANLCQVYDLMGYRHLQRKKPKEKADAVEAIIGEIVLRLHWEHRDVSLCLKYRSYLDTILCSMLRNHFHQRRLVSSGPLHVSFNQFACLPEEFLDDDTGTLVVKEGEALIAFREEETRQKSFADILEEEALPQPEQMTDVHHAFNIISHDAMDNDSEKESLSSASLSESVSRAMRFMKKDDILCLSLETFEVFKIYGMAVLSERVSMALAYDWITATSSRKKAQGTRDIDASPSISSPATLTNQRQMVLCVDNLSKCAKLLHVVRDLSNPPDSELDFTRLRANSLRAFVGFHAALRQSELVHDVVNALLCQALGAKPQDGKLSTFSAPKRGCWTSSLPARESLRTFPRTVEEASEFMSSGACDDLHLAGERPLLKKLLLQTPSLLTSIECAASTDKKKPKKRLRVGDDLTVKEKGPSRFVSAKLMRFQHRRFLFCLEQVVVLFAQRDIVRCRSQMGTWAVDLEPCAGDFSKWEVSTSCLTLAMRDSFFRLLLHDMCSFYAVVSSSKTLRDGTRVTQVRLPLHYSWNKVAGRRITDETEAVG